MFSSLNFNRHALFIDFRILCEVISTIDRDAYSQIYCYPNLKRFESIFLYLFFEETDLYLGSTVTELFELPTALEFSRNFVSKNIPVVIREATTHWPACTKWNSKYFR